MRADARIGVAEPETRPAELAEGVVRHPVGRLGHQPAALELRIEPEATHIAALAVVGPQVDATDQFIRTTFEHDGPVELLAARHLSQAVFDMRRGTVAR